MQVAVVGAGAVGLGLASLLARSGARPVLVVRSEATRRALATEGIVRSGIFGDDRVPPEGFDCVPSIGALAGHRFDYTLFCHKSPASASLAREAVTAGDALGTLVLCQNGWGNAEAFRAHFPSERVYNAVVITGFHRRGEASVEITAHAEPIRIGSLFGAAPERTAPLCAAIADAGVPCETVPEIEPVLFAKLLYNCLLNPLGALVKQPYGKLGESPHTRAVIEALAHELFAVGRARGILLPWPDAKAYLAHFYEKLLPPTARHESSMLQDLRAGRATEIDALSGAVAALGREHGVPTPVHRAICALVHAAEQKAR